MYESKNQENTSIFIVENPEWSDIRQYLSALQEVKIEENDRQLVIRSQCVGICGKIFQSVGVAGNPKHLSIVFT